MVLAPYAADIHQVPDISIKLSWTGGCEILSKKGEEKKRSINQIQFLGLQQQLHLHAPRESGGSNASCSPSVLKHGARVEEQDMPVLPKLSLPAPSGHIMWADFTSAPSIYFLLEPFVSFPLSTGKAPSRLPMLLTQSLLCLLAHKYLQLKASMVPSTNRKEYSWESSGSLPYGSEALLPMQSHTNALGWGSLGQGGTEQGSEKKVPQINGPGRKMCQIL